MQLLYFAWVRERIGVDSERLVKPDDVMTAGDLLDWLSARSPGHAEALADRARLRIAINQDYAGPDSVVADQDEIAIFPPVTGGQDGVISVQVQAEAFDPGAEQARLTADRADIGAVVCFTGLMRGGNKNGPVEAMTLEHYPGMTLKEITRIAREAERRWSLLAGCIIHRHGRLRPGDPIVLVAIASDQRRDAFEAASFLMDWLKTRAPFWKKEQQGRDNAWVEAKAEDDQAATRWIR